MCATSSAKCWYASNCFNSQGAEVPELEWCEPGEKAALEVLMGDKSGFLKARFKNYSSDRNNPLKPKALSGLSPYLHFGQISAQRCALEAEKVRKLYTKVCEVFSIVSNFLSFSMLSIIIHSSMLYVVILSEACFVLYLKTCLCLGLLFLGS